MKFPENTARFSWTRHVKNKMLFYNVSGAQILRVLSKPDRREEAIAPETIGAMRVIKHNVNKSVSGNQLINNGRGRKLAETELWIMYKINSQRTTNNLQRNQKSKLEELGYKRPKTSKITMISVWRYPGRTKPGERPDIPEGVLEELEQEGEI